MKKKVWIPMLIVLLLLCCTGCGKTAPVSEDMVKESVQRIDTFMEQGMTINSVTIDEQKTDTENKTDQIFVTVEASNEESACTAKYELNYHLYDQGWSLESILKHKADEWIYKPLKGIAQEIVEEKVQKMCSETAELIDSNEDLEKGLCVYTYSEIRELEHCNKTRVIEARYVYNSIIGEWKHDSTEVVDERCADWDIVGTWNAVAASSSWIASGWSEGIVVTVKSLGEDTAEMSINHPEVGVFFDGTIPFDPNSGIEFYVDGDAMGSPDYFTVVIYEDGAELLGVGMRPDEPLKRQ